MFNISKKMDRVLYDSIRLVGMEQPIVVVQLPDGGLQIRSGHRRYQAALALHMDTVPCVLGTNNDDANHNVGLQLAANDAIDRMGAWQRMRTLGQLATAQQQDDPLSMAAACRLVAGSTGMKASTVMVIVNAFARLHWKARALLEDNLDEASLIPQRVLVNIAHKRPDKHVALVSAALGLDESETDSPAIKHSRIKKSVRPRVFHHELRGLPGTTRPVRVRVTCSRSRVSVEVTPGDAAVLQTEGMWTEGMQRLIRQSIDGALNSLAKDPPPPPVAPRPKTRSGHPTKRDSTIVAIVPTRDYHEMRVSHDIPPIKPLDP
jgi:hypothetical protein